MLHYLQSYIQYSLFSNILFERLFGVVVKHQARNQEIVSLGPILSTKPVGCPGEVPLSALGGGRGHGKFVKGVSKNWTQLNRRRKKPLWQNEGEVFLFISKSIFTDSAILF